MTSTISNSPHQEASSTIAQAAKFTTASKNNQNDINCVSKSNDSTQNDSTTNPVNINSHVDHTLTLSTQIKKKSASFLHRDYNRKPILARSQVSIWRLHLVMKENEKKENRWSSISISCFCSSRVIFSILYYKQFAMFNNSITYLKSPYGSLISSLRNFIFFSLLFDYVRKLKFCQAQHVEKFETWNNEIE